MSQTQSDYLFSLTISYSVSFGHTISTQPLLQLGAGWPSHRRLKRSVILSAVMLYFPALITHLLPHYIYSRKYWRVGLCDDIRQATTLLAKQTKQNYFCVIWKENLSILATRSNVPVESSSVSRDILGL